MNRIVLRKWFKRTAIGFLGFIVVFLFVVFPIAASFLITNSRLRFPERGPRRPEDVGLAVSPVVFRSTDGLELRGWWNAGDEASPVILFCHGLNRSRVELLERAAESRKKGYGVLLFDVRNHGESENGHTTLGIHETRDVCGARNYVTQIAPGRPQLAWGVSMGASTALLSSRQCPGFSAIISDSSFLSFRETIAHHIRLIFRLPSFPIANLLVALTGWRMGFDPDEGDVEAAVQSMGDVPVLFLAGSEDVRMPPSLAERLFNASQSPLKKIVVVPGAGHGNAFSTARQQYLEAVFGFLDTVFRGKPAL
jgi:alpha-beta hydrolase superfamily lysophospholipase